LDPNVALERPVLDEKWPELSAETAIEENVY
jgi:hypothetical protein